MAITIERRGGGHSNPDRGDLRLSDLRGTSPSAVGPLEGDLWYDSPRKRFVGRTASTVHKGFAGRFGPEFGAQAQTQISGGAITATAGNIELLSETGTSDILETINFPSDLEPGDCIMLTAVSGHTITIDDGTGNIRLNGGANLVLNTINDTLMLMLNKLGTQLVQVAHSNNTV